MKSAAHTALEDVMAELRKVAAETPQEYQRRWPYNWTVHIDSNQARLILEALETK